MSSGIEVLVVDDDHDIADSLAQVIEARGHSVAVAYTGDEAMQLAASRKFDIAFFDIVMPGKSGVESLYEIKRLQPDMTCYMMTGFSVEALISQALAGGALGVLHKPLIPEQVLKLLPSAHDGSVLIGDEDNDIVRAIGPALMMAGWPTVTARNAAEAQAQLNSTHIDAMILDLNDPTLTGAEVCAEVNRMGKHVPTLLVTGDQTRTGPVRRGGVAHLHKPVDPAEVLALIDRARPALRIAQ
ncbi:MAG TPA: response regulator [Aestuariivirgaceae bacterium]|nr:response regulator [Aestuariivirgaceae bacterium]